MLSKQVISVFPNRDALLKLLKVNPGLVIIKLGASWCGPCKKIAHLVDAFFASAPPDVICADIDVDDSIDLYSHLKTKRMVNGIPVILLYKRGNVSFIPDDSITGADPIALDAFFTRCGFHLNAIHKAYGNIPPVLNNIIVQKEK